VPLLIIWAPTWSWIAAANVLLGINQGPCWSTTVIMKIDLAGPERRGLAMGLNEAAGYLAVAVTAYLTGLIAAHAGLRPEPFYLAWPTPASASGCRRCWSARPAGMPSSKPDWPMPIRGDAGRPAEQGVRAGGRDGRI
jgi:MFS family permease